MNTSMQLKARVRNMAKEKNLEAEVVLRQYMLEKVLEKISLSTYKDNFVLKGGMLIAAIVGIDARSTMDMDGTLKGVILKKAQIETMFASILAVEISDEVKMKLVGIDDIRDEAEYPGFRVTIEAILDKTRQMIKLDITTVDIITPKEINYSFKLLFEDRAIEIKAYNLETVLAEKLESVIIRGTTNTRMRDFYDIHMLISLHSTNIDMRVCSEALKKTTTKRKTNLQFQSSTLAVDMLEQSSIMVNLWKRYQGQYKYAEDITWQHIIDSVKCLMEYTNIN